MSDCEIASGVCIESGKAEGFNNSDKAMRYNIDRWMWG